MLNVTCEGCGRDFTASGYGRHLAQTRNPQCIAIYQQFQNYLPEFVGDAHQEGLDMEVDDVEGENEEQQFEGDYFGAYHEDELPWDTENGDKDDVNDIENGHRDNRDENHGDVPGGNDNNDRGPYITTYPNPLAGAPIHMSDRCTYQSYSEHFPARDNIWAPFTSQIDYEVARWAKLRGSGSTAFTDLLKIDGVCDLLKLSYRNSGELNKIIDNNLPGRRPRFQRQEIIVAGEPFDVYFRDAVECVKALFSDPELARYLVFTPERQYEDPDKTKRMYHDMHTGKWWWNTQKKLDKEKQGGTIIPIILSSDKTQVTMFRNKSAYPIYMTIGNIPKDIRRKPSQNAQILLGYLPTTRLEHISNRAARRRTLANLFHACMRRIVEPLKAAGVNGLEIMSGDGTVRRGHPILACYVGDYPEQVLIAGTKTGECPKCDIGRGDLGNPDAEFSFRHLGKILDALALADADSVAFTQACKNNNIKPVYNPFWTDLPHANIFQSITPDILHQLYQGMIKHLIAWIKEIYGETELDARC
ncbi:hypothetical protein BJ138DRAFT_1017013, partial [Hygrophoropsis aurantiaca]